MRVICMPVGELDTNCYLVADDSGSAALIDPGGQAEDILARAEKEALNITHILLTHAHFDHMLAAEEVIKATGAKLCVYADDQSALTDPVKNLTAFFAPDRPVELTADRVLREGDSVQIGDLHFTVLHTPGHTPGSCCYLCEDALFSGDTLFSGSEGRTDFPGGDYRAIAASLRRLASLDGDRVVYAGHGPATTLERERKTNPYMTGRYDEFDT